MAKRFSGRLTGTVTFYSVCMLLAYGLGLYLDTKYSSFPIAAGVFVVSAGLCLLVYWAGRTKPELAEEDGAVLPARYLIGTFLLIFLAWTPCFLAYYPVLFNYDVDMQFANGYSTHHPLLHTVLCKAFWRLGTNVFHSVNAAFALYALCQMAVCAASLSFSLWLMAGRRTDRRWYWGAALLICLYPAYPVMAVSMTKDVLFSAFFLLTVTLLIGHDGLCQRNAKLWRVGYGAALTLALLLRNNAVYACGLFAIVMLGWALFRPSARKRYGRALIVTGIAIVLSLGINAALKNALNARTVDIRESFSVPLQQLAAVSIQQGDSLPPEEREELRAVFPGKIVFLDSLSDTVRNSASPEAILSQPAKFLALYARLGLRYPGTCLKAVLRLTMGYWYLGDETHVHVYDGLMYRQGYLLTDMKDVPGVEVTHQTKLPFVEGLYERFTTENVQTRIPVLSALFTPAFSLWALLGAVLVLWLRRKRGLFPGCLFLVCYMATLVLGPCSIMRYALPFVYCLPIFALLAFGDGNARTFGEAAGKKGLPQEMEKRTD